MVKDINIHTTFEDKSHIFQCPQKEFMKNAAEYFHIEPENMVLFAVQKGEKLQISYSEITDLMNVEIVDKKAKSDKSNNQRTLQSYFSDQLPKKNDNFELIISKLEINSPLTGLQRKKLSDWLEEYNSLPPRIKRKLGTEIEPQQAHKKIQACVKPIYLDGESQTDISEIVSESDNAERIDHVIAEMKKLASQEYPSEEEVSRLMTESFEDRRNFILIKNARVSVVKCKYPLLFSATQVKDELDRIFYPGKQKEFLVNIEKYSEVILAVRKKLDAVAEKLKESLARCRTPKQKKHAIEVGSVLLIPKLMDEPVGFINLTDNYVKNDVFPYIDAGNMELKELFLFGQSHLFKIIVEQQLLCEVDNFKDAVLCLLAAFFIFNINYPEICTQTYVMFEKLYLSANDTEEFDDYTEQMIKLIKLKSNRG